MSYFNFRLYQADGYWDRRSFAHNWWRIYRGDGRWTPPYYPTWRWALEPTRNPHLARLNPGWFYLEGIRRPRWQRQQSSGPVDIAQSLGQSTLFELPLAAGLLLQDPRRRDGTGYLAQLHLVNDEETIATFLDMLTEQLWERGCHRLLLPTGISPHLASGWLLDNWHLDPPRHTPYSPPYLPELVAKLFRPWQKLRLYHLPVLAEPVPTPELTPFAPQRLAGDLLPLLAVACDRGLGFPAPDAAEATFLLRWLGRHVSGWLVQDKGQPVGFVLLQPDEEARLRQAGGAKAWGWRLWWWLNKGRQVENGRLLFAAVLPEARGQGFGRQLLQQALHAAQSQGWRSLTVGPLREGETAVALLQSVGAIAKQTYQLYEWQV
jgi:GNAT superfamily N-acetyltransferase